MPDHKASILIVEDEEFVRTSLAEILRYSGIECGGSGMACRPVEINEEVPEILLSDLNMPACLVLNCYLSSASNSNRSCDSDECAFSGDQYPTEWRPTRSTRRATAWLFF